MDPEFAAAGMAALQAVLPPPASGKSPQEVLREQMKVATQITAQYHARNLPQESTYAVEDKLISVENGEIRVRCLVPTAPEGSTFPVLVWFHGGGYIAGNIDADDIQLRSICVELQIVVVNVDYRLAPEHPFPVGLNDAYAAVKWTAENAQSLHVSLSKGFIIGGDSAGASFTSTCAHLARDDPFFEGRQITGQLLREPPVCHPDAYPEQYKAEFLSLEQFKDGPVVTRDSIIQICDTIQARPDDPLYSSLLFPSHAGVSPAVILYNGMDPLRDDARVLDKVLREAGVRTKTVCYPGVPHGFYYACPGISLSQKVERDVREGLKWLLSGSP